MWSWDDSKPRVAGHAIGCPCGVGYIVACWLMTIECRCGVGMIVSLG